MNTEAPPAWKTSRNLWGRRRGMHSSSRGGNRGRGGKRGLTLILINEIQLFDLPPLHPASSSPSMPRINTTHKTHRYPSTYHNIKLWKASQ